MYFYFLMKNQTASGIEPFVKWNGAKDIAESPARLFRRETPKRKLNSNFLNFKFQLSTILSFRRKEKSHPVFRNSSCQLYVISPYGEMIILGGYFAWALTSLNVTTHKSKIWTLQSKIKKSRFIRNGISIIDILFFYFKLLHQFLVATERQNNY